MNISKTTFNFAEKRGLEIILSNLDGQEIIELWWAEQDSECGWEAIVTYTATEEGLKFCQAFEATAEVKEELPYWVQTEMKLREVIAFIAANS